MSSNQFDPNLFDLLMLKLISPAKAVEADPLGIKNDHLILTLPRDNKLYLNVTDMRKFVFKKSEQSSKKIILTL